MRVGIVRSPLLEVESPGAARAHARAACVGVTSPGLTDAVLIVVSELVTNAMMHGRGEVHLDLWIDPAEALVSVWDAGHAFDWTQKSFGDGALGGGGLRTVAALAATHGASSDTRTAAGKSVWCVVRDAAPGVVDACSRPGES